MYIIYGDLISGEFCRSNYRWYRLTYTLVPAGKPNIARISWKYIFIFFLNIGSHMHIHMYILVPSSIQLTTYGKWLLILLFSDLMLSSNLTLFSFYRCRRGHYQSCGRCVVVIINDFKKIFMKSTLKLLNQSTRMISLHGNSSFKRNHDTVT